MCLLCDERVFVGGEHVFDPRARETRARAGPVRVCAQVSLTTICDTAPICIGDERE